MITVASVEQCYDMGTTDEGDDELMDEGIKALFGKGGAGDIALYLKKLFNEKHVQLIETYESKTC